MPVTSRLRLTLLGAGAIELASLPAAGLLVRYQRRQVMLDGGPGAEPSGRLVAGLVNDERSPAAGRIAHLAGTRRLAGRRTAWRGRVPRRMRARNRPR